MTEPARGDGAPLRVLIVDDEGPARRKVRRLLEEEPDVTIVGEAADGTDAVAAIREQAPDVVFLDIQMPGLDGFGVVATVGAERMPHIVFVTAYDEHALRAFEVHAIDYLLKPVDPERFRAAVARARALAIRPPDDDLVARVARLVEERTRAEPRWLERILVDAGNRSLLLAVEQIDWIEAARNYVTLHAGKERYTVRASIGALHGRLDPSRFLRVNRSQLVRLDAVKELHPWFHGEYIVLLHDGTRLTWSRRFRKEGVEFEIGGEGRGARGE
ncbi:MAG TPA: response regulator [Gemmatimonadaceae bacterium]|nr:response regulator [Gemmatimonadaceae bacterium]